MSSSSSGITATTVNGTTRITGLSSGLDVDGIVEQLITAEKSKKLNKLQQKEQTAEWTQEAYRSVIDDLTEFQSTYFSTTSSSSIMKASNFLKYTATSSSSAITVSSSTSATAGSHTVSVSQLATEATYASDGSISKEVQGSAEADYTSLSGESFVIALDGTSYTVDLDDVTDLDSLQDAINDAVGSTTKVTVSENSTTGYLEITAQDDSGVQKITISATDDDDDGLSELFGSDSILSNRLSTSSTLETISEQLNTALTFDTDGEFQITINGTTKSFDKETTLATMISEINDADLGATLSYNSLTGELVLTADDTGAGNTLTVADSGSGNFVSSLLSVKIDGTDAVFTIDGLKMTRSTNSVTVDGVTYTANDITDEKATVTVTQDTDGIYDLIENFVDAYNELIASINNLVDEDADSDYPPLTDDQKEDMTDDEITAWEAKAKVGLLESDSILRGVLSDLRTALIDSISGTSTTLANIGITTGDYGDNGTLEIDEDTLTAAIESDPEAIMELFTQKATSTATTSSVSGKSLGNNSVLRSLNATDLSTRYKEEGIAYRFYDILDEVISTKRDSAGNKGTLLEKAGIENDTSDTDNTLSTLIDKYEDAIDDEEDRLDELQEKLYTKYTTLETYINTMNSQLSAISSLTSSS
ncbi:Flagellar hook-associated protein 2 [Sporomusa ovata DSM 2662]|uniref:Flagellar hook-associated protein 2 n=1 Tax=Sporomusa ovata TaxID=2378 RepID=A0A0U1KWZ6_9FIRM|nr:flagellar filament capping protein FliD [Sporomusa ovata]EQB28342.1 flagellar hook-associated protein 2 [Sporomusa ovata DSM 2662]CQR71980.1 Flagellar hook-associated protein FliD [Sporomusa ovata]